MTPWWHQWHIAEFVLTVNLLLTACGSSTTEYQDISGRWIGEFAGGSAELELVGKARAEIVGTLHTDEHLYSITGTTKEHAFHLVLLPRDDGPLEAIFGLPNATSQAAPRASFQPLHAGNRFDLVGQTDHTYTAATGVVTSALLTGETRFTLQRP